MFVFCTPFLLVLSCGVLSGSLLFTSLPDAQTAQMVSFEILLLFRLCKYSKSHAYIMPKSTKNEANATV